MNGEGGGNEWVNDESVSGDECVKDEWWITHRYYVVICEALIWPPTTKMAFATAQRNNITDNYIQFM